MFNIILALLFLIKVSTK